MLLSSLRAAAVLLALFSALTGVVYPLTITVSAQLLFPREANGSLVESGRKVVGSSLIGQAFDGARYFWGRPSATASVPYNAAASTGHPNADAAGCGPAGGASGWGAPFFAASPARLISPPS